MAATASRRAISALASASALYSMSRSTLAAIAASAFITARAGTPELSK